MAANPDTPRLFDRRISIHTGFSKSHFNAFTLQSDSLVEIHCEEHCEEERYVGLKLAPLQVKDWWKKWALLLGRCVVKRWTVWKENFTSCFSSIFLFSFYHQQQDGVLSRLRLLAPFS